MCEYSDLIQKYYGNDVWAKVAFNSINRDVNSVIFDDWRRYVESDYLKNQNIKLITVYLNKTNHTIKPSIQSSHYENNIKQEDCDIVFNYNEDYSNFTTLVELIKNALI